MKLVELKSNESGYIAGIRGSASVRQHIRDMGLRKGETITMLENAPLQDPLSCMIDDRTICLGRAEAELIDIITNGDLRNAQDNGYRVKPGILPSNNNMPSVNVALIGTPNSGKTSLYNNLSKSQDHVGNYSGVTVGLRKTSFLYKGYQIILTDFPGIESISGSSEEELKIRNFITGERPDIILHVVNANHIERDLQLTAEIIEMNANVVVALNMYDEFQKTGSKFDFLTLGKMLGIPIVPTVAHKGLGSSEILGSIIELFYENERGDRQIQINYGPVIEQSIRSVEDILQERCPECAELSLRFSAIKLLEGDPKLMNTLDDLAAGSDVKEVIDFQKNRLRSSLKDEPDVLLADARYGFVSGALMETLQKNSIRDRKESDVIDTILTHKVFGLPILMLILFIVFYATFELGRFPMQWLEAMIAMLSDALTRSMTPGPMADLLIDGIIGGVGSVLVFLPNILILFYLISLMEDTGYMARAAFIMDNIMHKIGLHGRSFIPLVMGFGCNVPAIMASRAVKNKNNRILTMLINPFMSCSARLPVYILVIGAFFPHQPGLVLFVVYALGIAVAAFTALLFKKTVFRVREVPYVMELPPYRVPVLKVTLRHMWSKGSEYLKKMGGIILVASIIIWGLGYYPSNKTAETLNRGAQNENTSVLPTYGEGSDQSASNQGHSPEAAITLEHSYIGRIGKFIEPALRPLGFDWKMSISILTGVAAKEVVVSTMGVLYQADNESGPTETLAERMKSERYLEGSKQGEFVFNPVVGLSFMVFILLYFPCIATIAAIRKESGSWGWALFSIVYSTAVAWIMAFFVYQIGSLFI